MDLPPAAAESLRFVLFFGLLALVGTVERARPRRLSDPQRPLRWAANFGLVALGTALILALSLSATAASIWAAKQDFGFFNRVAVPPPIAFIVSWLFLDFAIYVQHRAFHEIRWLWPLHRVHHSDVEFDVTTGLRFHPGELLLSQFYKCAVAVALGAPWPAVLSFEIGLSVFAILTHANIRLPEGFDRAARVIFVTPDLHRVHHSVYRDEYDTNFGNLLSVWDRLFRTLRAAPRDGHREMKIGLTTLRHPAHQNLVSLLRQPLEP